MQIDDLGPPDEANRLSGAVSVDGVHVATLVYMAWPGHLMVFEATVEEGADEDIVGRAALWMFERANAERVTRLTHYGIERLGTLRAYEASPLAVGCAVSGMFGSRGMSFDPLRCLDLSKQPEPATDTHEPIALNIMFMPELQASGLVSDPSFAEAFGWLEDGDDMVRVATIRRLAFDERIRKEVAGYAHVVAMLNQSFTVRQFASMQLAGMNTDILLEADLDVLLDHLRDPSEVLRVSSVDPATHPWGQAQSRRNARYAVLWTLSNIAWTSIGGLAAPWLVEITRRVRSLLAERSLDVDPARDAWLRELATLDLVGDEATRFALGTEEDLDLWDCMRFVVLRARIIRGLGFQKTDKFLWMLQSVDAILDDTVQDPTADLARALGRAELDDTLPAGLSDMPEWSYGENQLTGLW